MSLWKQLTGKLRQSQIVGVSKPKKFTPRKLPRQCNSPIGFQNKTLDRLNSSSLSQQKEKTLFRNPSKDNSLFQQPRVSNVMKASSNSIRVNIRGITDYQPKNSVASHNSSLLNPDEAKKNNKIDKFFLNKTQKSYLFQQIKKIKHQFCVFQSIVFKQLEKQQKFINQTLQKIVKQINSQQNIQPKKHQHLFLQSLNSPKAGQYIQKYSQNKFLPDMNNRIDKIKKTEEIRLLSQIQISPIRLNNPKINNKSFDKIFKAVQNLKNDIKQLNMIGDISTITHTKSQTRNMSWQNIDNILKQKK